MDPCVSSPSKPVKASPHISFFKGSFIFKILLKAKKEVFTDLLNTVSHAFLCLFKVNQK